MNTRLFLISPTVVIIALSLFIGIGPTQSAFAETRQGEELAPVSLNQGGTKLNEEWEKFLKQTQAWLEQLAKLLAEVPAIGSIVAEINKNIGPDNVWFVGGVIVVLILLGFLALGWRR